jgi:hypothetical protein
VGRRRRKPLVARYNGVAIRFHGLEIHWLPNGHPDVGRRRESHHEVHHAAYTTEAGQERLYWIWVIAALWENDPTVRMEAATWMG